MLDREGFRPNVGIILLNAHNEVFWGKRLREHSWQFPQGGIKYGETPVQAMYRELHEETGLLPEHVKIIGRTRDWLRYEVPDKFIKREVRGHYRGQKQIWFLLRMVGRDCDICLRACDHPEFDAVDRLVVEYAIAAWNDSHRLRDRLFDRLREHFSEAQIVELTLRITLCGFFNKFNDALQIEEESEATARLAAIV